MMRNVFTKTLYDMRWTIVAFCAGLAVLAFVILVLYPSVAEAQREMFEGLTGDTATALLGSMNLAGTPEGYLNVQMFSFQPLYLAIFLIIVTSAAVAGEEGDKTLGVLLARPVARWKVLSEKALAIVVGLVVISIATAVGAVAGAAVAGVDISLGELALALLAAIPFGLWVLGFGLLCSALFRSRLVAALVATGVVVAGYMLNSLTEFVASLKTYAQFSPVYYYSWGQPLVGPVQWDDIAILLAGGLLFYLLALLAFQRREVLG
jgi:ABC-2 type transport system permease protein